MVGVWWTACSKLDLVLERRWDGYQSVQLQKLGPCLDEVVILLGMKLRCGLTVEQQNQRG